MINDRGNRTRLSIASTTGNRASATNRLIATSRMTTRTRQQRYRKIAHAATINTVLTTPPSDGAARRTVCGRVAGRSLAGAVADTPLGLVTCRGMDAPALTGPRCQSLRPDHSALSARAYQSMRG